jgi:hypothetical protein
MLGESDHVLQLSAAGTGQALAEKGDAAESPIEHMTCVLTHDRGSMNASRLVAFLP